MHQKTMTADLSPQHLHDLLDQLLAQACKAGAEQADALGHCSHSLHETIRLGQLESIERAESASLGLRVLIGKRQASVATARLDATDFPRLAERAVAMARLAPEDPWCGLADTTLLAQDTADLELDDNYEPDETLLRARATEAEDAARAIAGITNSEGATAGWSRGYCAFADSNGFNRGYAEGDHQLACSVVAEKNAAKERDYAYSACRHFRDLDTPADIGREAAERAVNRLDARKPQGAQLPVIYDERIAASLLRHFAQAISAASVVRGTSFLQQHLHKPVFSAAIDILDDPFRPRGLASRPFDDEGVAGAARRMVDKGVLCSWLIDSASGRQLSLPSTGHASRSAAEPASPEPSNLHILPGRHTLAELMADIQQGLYVTELIGHGVNPVTGDYSRGAAGFWIENGTPTFPVNEITVAGNLKDMFAHATPANDLRFRNSINAPSLRIETLTIAGL